MTTMDSGVTGTADSMMTVALDLTLVAAAMEVAPAVWVRLMFTWSQGSATNLNGAAADWAAAAAKVSDAADALDAAVSGVLPEDWTAGDRVRYEQAVARARSQLDDVRAFLDADGQVLEAVAAALVAYDAFAVVVAAILVGIGVAIVASESSVVGTPDVPGLEAAAWSVLAVVAGATAALAGIGTTAGEALQATAVRGARAESRDGDTHAYRDLEKGEEVGAAAAYANLVQDGANAAIDYVTRESGINGMRQRLGFAKKGEKPKYQDSNLGVVDIDADRSWDRTWNVGGGAQYAGAGASAHVEYGDRGLDSVNETGSYQAGSVNLEGSQTQRVDSRGDLTETAGASAGVGSTASGAVTGHAGIGPDGAVSYGGTATGHVGREQGTASTSGEVTPPGIPLDGLEE